MESVLGLIFCVFSQKREVWLARIAKNTKIMFRRKSSPDRFSVFGVKRCNISNEKVSCVKIDALGKFALNPTGWRVLENFLEKFYSIKQSILDRISSWNAGSFNSCLLCALAFKHDVRAFLELCARAHRLSWPRAHVRTLRLAPPTK